MHTLLVLESFAHSLPHGESLVRKLTTALLEKVFFSQFVSLHCHLSFCISQMAPLYQSKTSFISNPFVVSLQPFSLFQYRQVKSLEVLQHHSPLVGFQWLAFLYLSPHIWVAFPLTAVSPCLIFASPP